MLRRIFGILLALSAWYCGMSLKRILFLGSVWLFILFVVVPTVFRSCSTLQRHMVFLPYVHWPKLIDFEDPESEGLLGARNFYLQTEKKCSGRGLAHTSKELNPPESGEGQGLVRIPAFWRLSNCHIPAWKHRVPS